MKDYIVAIDLGSSDVVVTVGSRGDNGRIAIEAVATRPSKGIVRGEVKNVEQAAQAIKEAVAEVEEKLGITIEEAYTGVSGSHIKCAKHPYYVYVAGKDGEIFEEDVRKLNDSMRGVQAPDGFRLLHIVPQHYLVDDEEEVADPVGMFGKTLGSTFNLIVGDNVILSRLEKALQKVGISQAGLFINALATSEAVTFPDEKDLGVAVVDLGAGTTDVCIFQDGIVRYVGIIPLGSDSINKDIRSYGIMERYVEELKIKYGCAVADMVDGEKLIKVPGRTPSDYKEISFRNLASIIEARLIDIADYVVDEIKASGYEGKLAAGIVLTGGSAQMKEIGRLMEDRTKLEVRIAVPEPLVEEGSREAVADTRFSAAVGLLALAMESGGSTKTSAAPHKFNAHAGQQQPQEQEHVFNPVQNGEVEWDMSGHGEEYDEFLDDDYDAPAKPKKEKKVKVKKEKAPKPPKEKKRGIIQMLKDKIEKTLDMDVLDDDETLDE